MLLGQPLGLCIGLVSVLACLIWYRKAALLLLAALVLAQFSLNAQSHQELRSIASEYQTRTVEIEAIQSGSKLTKVRIVSLEGCPSCSGAYGQYSGTLSVGDKLTGVLMIRPSFGFGEFVAKGSGKVSVPAPTAISAVRAAFLENLSGLSLESRALVAGLAIGDTSLLPEELNEEFKTLSLTHLNAVS